MSALFFGSSVALSGDTAAVGAYLDDDSGSAYVFRITATDVADLIVHDHSGSQIVNGTPISTVPGLELGTSADYTFRIINGGALGLDLQNISLGGKQVAHETKHVECLPKRPLAWLVRLCHTRGKSLVSAGHGFTLFLLLCSCVAHAEESYVRLEQWQVSDVDDPAHGSPSVDTAAWQVVEGPMLPPPDSGEVRWARYTLEPVPTARQLYL